MPCYNAVIQKIVKYTWCAFNILPRFGTQWVGVKCYIWTPCKFGICCIDLENLVTCQE